MAKIHPKEGSVQEPFSLLYRNGQPVSSEQIDPPRFTDICLTKNSAATCENVLDEAKHFDRPIRNEQECKDSIALHSLVDETLAKLRELSKQDRQPFLKVLSQIDAALEPFQMQLMAVSAQLRNRITAWRALVVEGQRREQERLEREAAEKRNEAKYTDDAKKRRQATVKAEQLEKEAKEAELKAHKGLDTEVYWEGEIVNRQAASRLPDNIVLMEVDQQELNKHLRALERAGTKITSNILSGLTLTRKTRVRFHR